MRKIKISLGLILFFCIAFGYISGHGSALVNTMHRDDNRTPPSEVLLVCNEKLTFETLNQGYHYSDDSDSVGFDLEIINDWNQAEEVGYLILPHQGLPLSSQDYNKYFVVAISMRLEGHVGVSLEIEEICRNEKTIFIKLKNSIVIRAEESRDEGYPELHHIVRVEREDDWETEIDSVASIDGYHFFTQTHYIANPRHWDTLDKNETQSGWAAERPDLLVIATEDEISSVTNLLSPEAISTLQELDYEQSYALVAFQGQQPSAGYDIEITAFNRADNRVVIHTQATEPSEVAETHPDITSPYHLVRVDRFYENGDELDFVLSINGTEALTRTATIKQNPPIPTPTPVPTSTPIPTPVVPIITVGDYTVASGGLVNVMLDAVDFKDIGPITVDLRYDPNILQVMSCSKNLNDAFDIGLCNSQYLSDTIRFNAISARGISGDISLAEITFEAMGKLGEMSAIELEVNIADNKGQYLTADTVNGQVIIADQSMGDVNCDGDLDSIDGLFILQYEVDLRSGNEACPSSQRSDRALYAAACDVNADGKCDAADALIILQCDVGLRDEPC